MSSGEACPGFLDITGKLYSPDATSPTLMMHEVIASARHSVLRAILVFRSPECNRQWMVGGYLPPLKPGKLETRGGNKHENERAMRWYLTRNSMFNSIWIPKFDQIFRHSNLFFQCNSMSTKWSWYFSLMNIKFTWPQRKWINPVMHWIVAPFGHRSPRSLAKSMISCSFWWSDQFQSVCTP